MLELALNLVWVAASVTLVTVWLRAARHTRTPRRVQCFALLMAILLLLPVISISDDLAAAQYPAEADSALRRAADSHLGHLVLHPASFALPEPSLNDYFPQFLFSRLSLPQSLAAPATGFAQQLHCRPPPQA